VRPQQTLVEIPGNNDRPRLSTTPKPLLRRKRQLTFAITRVVTLKTASSQQRRNLSFKTRSVRQNRRPKDGDQSHRDALNKGEGSSSHGNPQTMGTGETDPS
jgi:hypothetical protein